MSFVPTVFVSYSHDSDTHKIWVENFAVSLKNQGINVILDVWHADYGSDLPLFMEDSIRESDRVLLVCTPTYAEKANARTGGVGYETVITTAQFIKNLRTTKFIPILRIREDNKESIPLYLGGRRYFDFCDGDNFDAQIKDLVHSLKNPIRGFLGNSPSIGGSNNEIYPPFLKYKFYMEFLTSSAGVFDIQTSFVDFKIDKAIDLTYCLEKEFIFAKNESDAKIATKINLEAFQNSPWSDLEEQKLARNYSFLLKNPYVMAMLYHNVEQYYSCYHLVSCVLPLTEEGWSNYTKASVTDNLFPSRFIASPDDETYALLLFMIASSKKCPNEEKFNDVGRNIHFMLRHFALVARYMKLEGKILPVIAQNNKGTIKRALKRFGFSENKNLNTLDEESVMEAKIKFCGSRECDEGIEQSNMRMLNLTC